MLGGCWSPKHLSKRGHPRLREPDCLPQNTSPYVFKSHMSDHEHPGTGDPKRSFPRTCYFGGYSVNNPPKAKSLSREVNLRCQEAPLRFGQRPCVAVPCDRDPTRPIDGRQVSPTASLLHVWKGQPDNSCLESTFPPIIVPYKFVSACKGRTNLLFWLCYSAFRFQNVRLGLQEAQIQPAWKYN